MGGYGEPFLIACDRMLAGRLLDQLPLGGRIAQARTLVSRDESLLPDDVLKFRVDGGPLLKDLMATINAGNNPAAQPSLQSVESVEAKVSALALSRIQLPEIAVPSLDTEKPMAALHERTGMLTFVSVGNRVYGVLAADGKIVMWDVPGANRLPGEIGRLLKAIGVGKNRGKRIAEDDSWKEAGAAIRDRLLPDDTILTSSRFDQLIVVPDGPLWYLPFEILPLKQLSQEDQPENPEPTEDAAIPLLGEKIAVRYAATPGLAMKPVAPPATNKAIGLASSKFFAPRDPEMEESMLQGIVDGMKEPVRLPLSADVPSSFLGGRVGHLVVAAAQNANLKNPLSANVGGYDRSSPQGSLAAWIRFPAKAPASVAMMGFRTPVDQGQMGDGNEIFMMLAGLQVAGVRDILISRWAVGGESSAMMLRELTQELPFIGLRESFARARVVLQNSALDPSAEPLLARAEADIEDLSGSYPLFWAGYLISAPDVEN